MVSTAADYEWFAERFPGLAQAYCISVIRVLTPRQVLDRLGATDRTTAVGVEPSMESDYDAIGHGFSFIAATKVGNWTVAIEPNGFLCTTPAAYARLSANTRQVTHFCNVNLVRRFLLVDDGDLRLFFEHPQVRSGSAPDLLVRAMADAGLAVTGDESHHDQSEATFAFVERITTVKLRPELLESATFHCGMVAYSS